ncbi:DNA cytosine methyltransferase [Agrobacterium sp. RAC06]|uniref:DNA cytosine methyltransferase n=1 Tax=Agrobacterium sp. RAC06 TaxID=1842536 RepID=UPI0008552BAE|nr:DNA cytosine methyltransferase [Agrobacterium sp. RAC06]AOG11793.1 DNA (cytosine-5-)-methyltransferase family protein [Agrobacterium sp. RAC06]
MLQRNMAWDTIGSRGTDTIPTSNIYSMIDLFAGCGGLSLGFENAGFTPVFVNELDGDARASYLLNRHHKLGGLRFSENRDLHSSDAHELKGQRLEQLVADLANIPELDLQVDKRSRPEAGGGSSIDVLAGGPPCQGFSGIGIRRSYSVDKKELPSNRLYVRMADVIRRVRPRVFLFENVRGLLNSRWTRDGGDMIFPDVLAEFRKITGYEVRWSLVFAKDYGVPQNRPRVLLVGIRKDILEKCTFLEPGRDANDAIACGFLPAGAPGQFPDLIDLLDDLIDDSVPPKLHLQEFGPGAFETQKYLRPPRTQIQKKLRKAPKWYRGKNVSLTEQEYSRHKEDVVAKFEYMLRNHGRIPEHFKTKKFSQRLLKPQWGEDGPNITATSLPDDYVHFAQPRILTVREWARLQLFPDWYQFAGKRTTGGIRRAGNPREGVFEREVPKYTQIGNAVPVGLAEHVGGHFKRILDEALGRDA